MSMKRSSKTLLFVLFMFSSVLAFGQSRTITGTVTGADDGQALPQVTILIKGTVQGTTTDADGKYSIQVPSSETILEFRFIGFITREVAVGNQSVIDVALSPDALELGEVVITGYGTSTKEKASIASTTVGAEKIAARPNASMVQTLSGQVAGLNITTTSGQPGANSTVNLRGVSSINGDTEPLFIIDGTPVDQDNFRSLNPNEIESISVLKDAGATAIYGNRGANGVIVINTKNKTFHIYVA